MALTAAQHKTAKLAADYLVSSFEKNGKWQDITAVGTGHPGIVYMEYPIYAETFPVMALSRYKKIMNDGLQVDTP